ncbi:MAG: helix-turn-helix domain-containing protein [Clostridiaceae bacterium]|jgi:transcriptional regulator with XRE-family HTH domain|nr:helix-turn-helix domain-containing protein [Clostridiaceae bacterium]
MQESSQNKTTQLIKTLGNIIKKHREAQGKTIYKISAEAGLPKATWRELELGLKNFRFSTLWKIAEGLDIPLGELMNELKAELGDDFTLSGLD